MIPLSPLMGYPSYMALGPVMLDIDQDGWGEVLIADVDPEIPGYTRRMHIYHNRGGTVGGTDIVLRFWWKIVMRMWNRALPAPEYQFGWGRKDIVAEALERILAWDFERVVVAHGDLIEHDARDILRKAWEKPLQRS